jgi:multisubunit Na+/H+ antiporter MnhG subunit
MAENYTFGADELNRELADELEPGEEFTDDDVEELEIEGVPERPSFPLVTFIFAILLDTGKLFSGGFLGIIFGILGSILVRVYLIGKMGFIKRYFYKKTVAAAAKNVIPILGAFLGSWTWFVFRAHSKNWKRIDQILTAIERLIQKRA